MTLLPAFLAYLPASTLKRVASTGFAFVLCLPLGAAGGAGLTGPSNADLANMFRVPGLPEDRKQIAWPTLPLLPSKRVEIFRGVENVTGFNHHPSIAYFDGRLFAIWNTGFKDEDASGQKVVFSTSTDQGLTWTAPMDITGRWDARRFTCVGLWQRGNELHAVVSLRDAHDEAGKAKRSDVCPLLAYRWESSRSGFGDPVVLVMNFFSNNIPQKAPDGEWMMLGKGTGEENSEMRVARGGTVDLGRWTVADMPAGPKMEEAEWYVLPDKGIVAHYRSYLGETPEGGRFIRLYSPDSGKTWSDRIVTNFPEASSRNHGFRLSNGTYVLLLNPNPIRYRVPLSLALSSDGLNYTKIANIRADDTKSRVKGRSKGPGYHYVRGLEHNGKLYAIYTVNKEDVEVSIIPLQAIQGL